MTLGCVGRKLDTADLPFTTLTCPGPLPRRPFQLQQTFPGWQVVGGQVGCGGSTRSQSYLVTRAMLLCALALHEAAWGHTFS